MNILEEIFYFFSDFLTHESSKIRRQNSTLNSKNAIFDESTSKSLAKNQKFL